MFDRYFVHGLNADPLLWQQHDPWLVLLSVLVSMGASAVALHLAQLARTAQDRGARQLALGSGALALGSGVWTMHYVGMLAFAICGHARFDPGITALSVLPSLGASWVALRLLVRERAGWGQLLVGGVLVGAGIGAMHYIGMAASELAPLMRYALGGFVLSIVVAVLLAVLALWVRFGLQQHLPGAWQTRQGWITALAGMVMGLAIAGMHYTGMAALRFIQSIESLERVTYTVPVQSSLALAIAVVTVALSLVVVAINSRLRYRRLYEEMQRSESRQRAVLETAVDAVVIISAQGEVQSFNPAAERLLGWPARDIVGRPVAALIPEDRRDTHVDYQRAHGVTGFARFLGVGRETLARHRDGRLIPVRLAVGRVEQPGEPLFVGFLTDLSEHKALEREREHGREQLRSLVANLPGVAFRCRNEGDWPMLFISEAVQAMTGWSAQDFIQGSVHWGPQINAEDAARIALDVDYALEHAQPYHVEYRITTRAGATRWLSEHGRGVPDEAGRMSQIDGVILDITDVRARSAELEGTLAAINRSRAAAQFSVDGHLIDANANYLELMGYTLDEVIGLPHASFCPPQYAHSAEYAQLWQRLRAGKFHTEECLRIGKDGREVWMLATYNPVLDADGKVSKVLKFASDMTQRRAMEQDLRAAKERAEAAAAARASFLANMSHEIRTPMNAIIGFTEALLDSPLEAPQRRQLGTVHHAARSMLRLLNDILDTAKLEKGAVELELDDFSLRELCEQILASLRIAAAKKGLALVLDYPADQPDYLRGDALRLQQVLVNLTGNAVKFTERGQVLLHVRYAQGELLLEVQDTGIGIAPAQIERIFDPFAQADASTTRRFGGTGLGTTISRQLVELMHGSIAVRSTPGAGSVFSVRLPLPPGSPPEAALQQPARTLPSLRVLAVDDVPNNLELLQLTMERGGHGITLAGSGEEAVRLCAGERFDLVLMDLQMPGVDGLEATRRIRAHEQERQQRPVPIVALSASVLEQDRRDARAAGMDGFAGKPLELPRLYAEIARVLGLRPDAIAAVPAPPPSAGTQPIDWERGLRLWTEAPLLCEALERFLHEHQGLPGRLQVLLDAADWPALTALAHRVRGVAGNLALAPLQALLGQLERAAREADTAAATGWIDALGPAWDAVAHALRAHTSPCAGTPAGLDAGLPAAAPLDAARAAEALSAMDHAAQALAQGELPETALSVLAALLPALALEPLREAIDAFDFDRAQAQLQALRTLAAQSAA